MRATKPILIVVLLICTLCTAGTALAGEITGRILLSDGSTCSSCRIQAYIKWGGMTEKVYTDGKGRFRLTWTNDNSIGELYVDGKKERENIPTGSYVEVQLH